MSHALLIEDPNGDLIDVINLCSDSCHRTYAARVRIEYQGWNGAQELEHTDYCANCGVVLPGFNGDNNGESCGDQDANAIVARFRSLEGERCRHHNGEHWIQIPSDQLID